MPDEYLHIAVCALVGKADDEIGKQPAWWYRQAIEYAAVQLHLDREERKLRLKH